MARPGAIEVGCAQSRSNPSAVGIDGRNVSDGFIGRLRGKTERERQTVTICSPCIGSGNERGETQSDRSAIRPRLSVAALVGRRRAP